MRSSFTISVTVLLSASSIGVQAQSVLDPSKLPACAFQCDTLTNAQSACVPPTVAASSQNAYQACYCSSAALTTLYSTSAGLCSSVCTSDEAQQIQSWYKNLCTAGIVVTPSGSTPTGGTTSSAAPSGTSSSASSASSGASSSSENSASSNSGAPKSWISTHYGWVIFLILLVLFLVLGFTIGLWLRRRHRRKQDAARFSSNAHLPGPGSRASPYGSGILSQADASFMGSRNHPQMTMVPDAGSEAAFERYGGYGAPPSRDTASPPPAAKGARNLVKVRRVNS